MRVPQNAENRLKRPIFTFIELNTWRVFIDQLYRLLHIITRQITPSHISLFFERQRMLSIRESNTITGVLGGGCWKIFYVDRDLETHSGYVIRGICFFL